MIELLNEHNAVLTVLALFFNAALITVNTFITDIKPGKPSTVAGKVLIFLVEKILVWVNPAELGRRLALKVNPDSLNARKVSRKITVTPDQVKAINRAAIDVNLPF